MSDSCDFTDCSTTGFSIFLGHIQIHVHWVNDANHLILFSSLLLLLSIFASIGVFPSESTLCIRWPKYWSSGISPSNEYSGLNSFRIDWFDLLVVQETLKSLLQHHNLKASILQCSAFFIIQQSHLYRTKGKTIAMTIQTSIGKVMSLSFLNLACTPGSSRFTYCWSLAWRILSIILLTCEMTTNLW